MDTAELLALVDDPRRRATVSPVEIAEAFLERIEAHRGRVDAVITPMPDSAILDAKRAELAREQGAPLPLDGMAIVLKDNIDVRGVRSTCGSKFFEHRIAEEDSEVVARLRRSGGVILGKAHCTEFMFALAGHHTYPPCKNPWDPARIPGASSSGSGAALAADECIAALGTDTGGSVRTPAAFSGVTGLRPTFGLVSTYGIFPLARSLDAVGTMARSVEDVASVLRVIAGYDPKDPRSVPEAPACDLRGLNEGIKGLRVGVATGYFADGVDPEIASAVRAAVDQLVALGACADEVVVSGAEAANEAFTLLIRAEALSVHRNRLYEHPEFFEVDVRDRLRMGEALAGYEVARLVEHLYVWRREVEQLFEEGPEVIATATAMTEPPLIQDAKLGRLTETTRLTYPWSYAYVPALSIPCGFTKAGLPVGLQLVAPRFREDLLLRVGTAYQEETKWHRRRPSLDGPVPVSGGIRRKDRARRRRLVGRENCVERFGFYSS
jgi:Asp-tRNA(Asn)/Glu-tRNA(Gln) amidotransferase A subunit family amidase